MPTYEYACTECGDRLEVVQRFSDDPLTTCPACGGKLRKVFSPVGIVFKGSGFYRTDSRSGAVAAGSAAKGSEGASGESSSASSASSDGAKADSPAKPEAAAKPSSSSSAESNGSAKNGKSGSVSTSSTGSGSKVA